MQKLTQDKWEEDGKVGQWEEARGRVSKGICFSSRSNERPKGVERRNTHLEVTLQQPGG